MSIKNQFIKTNSITEIKHEKALTRYIIATDYNNVFSATPKYSETTTTFDNYLLDNNGDILNIVKAALVTGKPIFLRGAPGSGKTQLAKAIAIAMYGEAAFKNYYEWVVKSYSKAKDGLYTFDHVERLRDSTLTNKKDRVDDPRNYIKIGPLGLAIKNSKPGEPAILLIDEIDKSDVDFGNDLLLELDEMRFYIRELDDQDSHVEAKERPLVFITSNDERTMSPAFIRRCLYYEIKIEDDLFKRIIASRLPSIEKEINSYINSESKIDLKETQLNHIISSFGDYVDQASHNIKEPSVAELIEWVKMLVYFMMVEGETFELAFERINSAPLLNAILTKNN